MTKGERERERAREKERERENKVGETRLGSYGQNKGATREE